jgi:thioredoxin reductase (NADPH)
MSDTKITVYGAYWCPDCRRAKKFLGENFIPFNWVDIEQDKNGEKFVLQKNNNKRIIPTVVFEDGSFLVEPSNAELAKKLDLKTEARMPYYDLIIVGGGPAGLTAGIYAAREGLETLVVERSGLGGQSGITVGIDNFPGFPEGIGGQELAERMVRQAERFGVEILQAREIDHVDIDGGYQCLVDTDDKHLHGNSILVASGAAYRRLEVPGEDDFIGAGIHFCATCDGPFYKGAKNLVVVGGGNSACEEGLHLTKFADKVTLLVRGDQITASQILIDKVLSTPQMDVRFNTGVEAFAGKDGKMTTIRAKNTLNNVSEELHASAAFIFIGQKPNSELAKNTLKLDKYGYILTGRDLPEGARTYSERQPFAFETSLPGIFAAGDVRHGSTKQVASAVGEGAAAAITIREFLKTR